ncbi:MAG: AAA family ATPase [Candidatus Bipolaricaulis sp.]|nr:AAA family ATPase [Candidatus Bipolaricaulis sp.]MDD5645752.1 AAA family ATPase [Candidatus Bipolaricaulis sp.]
MTTEVRLEEAFATFERLERAVAQVIVGQEAVVRSTLIALLCRGNVLLEGVPGLGKTLLVRTLAHALGLRFSRIQFTPDLMPADILGTNIITDREGARRFEFARGPIFAHIVLADEVNRATPKTQSALLEAMEERTVSVGGTTYALDEPFIVLATQNPIEMQGTYPLPEAQVDRFLLKVNVPFPSLDELVRITALNTKSSSISFPSAVASAVDVLAARSVVHEIPMAEGLQEYVGRLVLATHPGNADAPDTVRNYVEYGASPRGAIALVRAAKAHAFLSGQVHVRPADIEAVFLAALHHRIILNFRGEAEGVTPSGILAEVWRKVPVS